MSVKRYLQNPSAVLLKLGQHGLFRWMDDRSYIELIYRCYFHKKLDLDHPKTYNEKLQWLKLHDRKPEYVGIVDKCEVKRLVAAVIGEEHIIPTLGVWDSFDEIPFDELPDRFVLKCTHDSGSVVVVGNKNAFDRKAAKKLLEKHLRENYYWGGREWPYKDVRPRILAEQYLEESEGLDDLTDYKIHCYGGVPKSVQVLNGRFSKGATRNDFYTTDWERLPLKRMNYTNSPQYAKRPEELPELLTLAEKLSRGMIYVRTDFYIVGHKIYFGEITLYPSSGFTPFVPASYDELFGSWIRLPLESEEDADDR